MRIGELAKLLGISRDTIRRLEKRGVLAPKRDWAGHRRFTKEEIARIRDLLFKREGLQEPSKAENNSAQ